MLPFSKSFAVTLMAIATTLTVTELPSWSADHPAFQLHPSADSDSSQHNQGQQLLQKGAQQARQKQYSQALETRETPLELDCKVGETQGEAVTDWYQQSLQQARDINHKL